MAVELPILAVPDAAALAARIASSPEAPGFWLKLAKKGAGGSSPGKQEAIDVALSWGWIDGQVQRFDAQYFLIRLTPRRTGSVWSEINRSRALALIAEGRMTPRGQAEIDRARASGRWDAAYAPQSRAEVPGDLAEALAATSAAAAAFAALDGLNRYAVLYRSQTAKTPAARARRIAKLVDDLAQGKLPYSKRP